MLQFIQDNVVGFVPGGVMISYGALFVVAVWIAVYHLKKFMPKRRS